MPGRKYLTHEDAATLVGKVCMTPQGAGIVLRMATPEEHAPARFQPTVWVRTLRSDVDRILYTDLADCWEPYEE